MRRLFIFALSLSLTSLGPVPLSPCAIFSSKLAECSTPKTQSPCDRMNMSDDGIRLIAPSASCCNLSNAPVATRQQKVSGIALTTPAVILTSTQILSPNEEIHLADFEYDSSPPPLQSLLCTFLI
jgi:hypothetical protein